MPSDSGITLGNILQIAGTALAAAGTELDKSERSEWAARAVEQDRDRERERQQGQGGGN